MTSFTLYCGKELELVESGLKARFLPNPLFPTLKQSFHGEQDPPGDPLGIQHRDTTKERLRAGRGHRQPGLYFPSPCSFSLAHSEETGGFCSGKCK